MRAVLLSSTWQIVQGDYKDMVAISCSQATLVSAVYLRNRSIIGFMTS